MTSQILFRWAGLAAIISAGLAIWLTIPVPEWHTQWLHVLQQLLMLFGILGVYFYQYENSGRIGFVGFTLAFSGTAVFLVSGQLLGVDSLALGGVSSALGFVLLAIGSFRANKFPRWIPWLWIAGAIIGIPASLFVSYEGFLLLASATFFAGGFIGAGAELLSSP